MKCLTTEMGAALRQPMSRGRDRNIIKITKMAVADCHWKIIIEIQCGAVIRGQEILGLNPYLSMKFIG